MLDDDRSGTDVASALSLMRRVFSDSRAVLFIGAGVTKGSVSPGSPVDWPGLLAHGIGYCQREGLVDPLVASRMREDIRETNPIDYIAMAYRIAERLRQAPIPQFGRWLVEALGGLQIDNHRLLAPIAACGLPLVTTNYDPILDEVTRFPPITWKDRDKIASLLRGNRPAVFHLHGYYEWPDTVVFGPDHYRDIVSDAFVQTVLRALLLENTLVFIGVGDGLADPNLAQLLGWAGQYLSTSPYDHYRLVTKTEFQSCHSTGAEDKALAAGHVRLVVYGDDHAELPDFLWNVIGGSSHGVACLEVLYERLGHLLDDSRTTCDEFWRRESQGYCRAQRGRVGILRPFRRVVREAPEWNFHGSQRYRSRTSSPTPIGTCHRR